MKAEEKRVLIVEDEMILSMNIKFMLMDMGYGVSGILITGEEALAAIDKDRPDAVLIDITLDGELDGIETSRRIRDEHSVPIIFMTGNTDPDTLRRARELDPVDIMTKPVTERMLGASLRKAFS